MNMEIAKQDTFFRYLPFSIGENHRLEGPGQQDKRDAYDTLYTVLVPLMKVAAPLLPLLADVTVCESPTAEAVYRIAARRYLERTDALLKAGFREDQLKDLTIYSPVGCDSCTGGYKGRVGIYQVMPVSEEMGRLIMEGGNSMQLEQQARKEGVDDLRASGLRKVAAGITSLEEVDRVTKE